LLGGTAFADAATAVLVQLEQVDYLCLNNSPGFTDAGLLQLAVMDLRRLYVDDDGLTDAISKGRPVNVEWSEEVRAEGKVTLAQV
jgi:hypothetical protein